MEAADTTDLSLFRRERWPNLALGAFFFLLFGGWFLLPPLLLGLAAVWPLRHKAVALFRAQRRWERELAIGFSGFLVGLVFLIPYGMLVKQLWHG